MYKKSKLVLIIIAILIFPFALHFITADRSLDGDYYSEYIVEGKRDGVLESDEFVTSLRIKHGYFIFDNEIYMINSLTNRVGVSSGGIGEYIAKDGCFSFVAIITDIPTKNDASVAGTYYKKDSKLYKEYLASPKGSLFYPWKE